MSVDEVTVVVPAHQEEAGIADCLRSIAAAASRVVVPVSLHLVLDSCSDSTADVVRDTIPELRALAGVTIHEVQLRSAGASRARGFRGATLNDRAWFCTTDADSRVPPDWIAVHLDSAGRGHDLFAGTIRVDDWSCRAPGTEHAHEANYRRLDGHRHIHGANLGINARAYRQLGGFADLACDEDVDLVQRAIAAKLPVDWSARASVITSARRSTRTRLGFSATLGALERNLRAAERTLCPFMLEPLPGER